ncbi:hypothetical protein HK102_010417 [Quaeritorhiza haematococci]|nr:hypothetical protein HK102_010417 [Quaeritorhiza haematococci]
MMLRLVTGDKDAEYEVLRELLWVNSFGDQEAYAYKVLFLLQRKVKSMQAWYGGGLVPVLQQMADPTNAFFDEQLPATFWPPAPTKPQIMPALFATGDVRSWFGNMMQRLATAGPSEAEKAAVEEQILSELMWLHPWEEEAYKSLWDVKRKVESLVAIYAGDPQGFDMALKAAATEDTTSRFLDGLKSRVVTTTTGR